MYRCSWFVGFRALRRARLQHCHASVQGTKFTAVGNPRQICSVLDFSKTLQAMVSDFPVQGGRQKVEGLSIYRMFGFGTVGIHAQATSCRKLAGRAGRKGIGRGTEQAKLVN